MFLFADSLVLELIEVLGLLTDGGHLRVPFYP